MSDERYGRVQEEGHVGPTPGQADRRDVSEERIQWDLELKWCG